MTKQSGGSVAKDSPTASDVHMPNADNHTRPSRFKATMTRRAQARKRDGAFSISFDIMKSDAGAPIVNDEQRLVFGWASIVEEGGQPVVDSQDDVITEAEIVKAAHEFMGEARHSGEMHEAFGSQIGTIVESAVMTKDVQKAMGIDLKKVGWWICARVASDDVWKKVKSGEYGAFSIGGSGVRVPA